jgi:anti-sigma regulatory factor (Ser/Thr protein kinase)
MYQQLSPDAQVVRLDLPAAYPYLHLVGESIDTMLRRGEETPDRELEIYALQQAAHEACSLIISRAYYPNEEGRIGILLSMTKHPLPPCAMIEIQDNGRSLNVDFEREPIPENILESGELVVTRLFLMHKLTDSIRYRAVGRTNSLCMVKVLS